MGTLLTISAVSPVDHTPHAVLKPFGPPSAKALVPNPTMAQMLQEPLYQLRQQAQAGNAVAKQLLAREQDKEEQGQAASGASAGAPEAGRVDILAG